MTIKLAVAIIVSLSMFALTYGTSGQEGNNDTPKIKPLPLESEAFNDYFANRDNVPTIHGQIVGFDPGELKELTIQYIFQVPTKIQQTKLAKIDRNGRFEFELEYAFPLQEVMLKVGKLHFSSFIVHQDLTVELDLEKLKKRPSKALGKGIRFSGEDAAMTEYLYRFGEKTRMKMTGLAMQRSMVSGVGEDPAKGLETLANIYSQEQEILDKYIKKHPSQHAWILKENLATSHFGELLMFHIMSRGTTDSEVFNACVNHQPTLLNTNTAVYYHNLSMLLARGQKYDWWESTARQVNTDPSEQEDLEAYIETMSKMRTNKPYNKELAKAGDRRFVRPHQDVFTEAMTAQHLVNIEEKLDPAKAKVAMILGATGAVSPSQFMKAALPQVQEGWCRTLLREQYQEDLDRIDEVRQRIQQAMVDGEGALGEKILTTDGIHLIEANHSGAKEFAEALGRSFPGKAIVLDFWSMTCGACINDMQNSKETKSELADQPIAFVYVCLDSKKRAWMEKIVDIESEGHHVFLNEKLSAQAMEYFEITRFPTIVFIDQQGNYDPDAISFLSSLNVAGIKRRLKIDEAKRSNDR